MNRLKLKFLFIPLVIIQFGCTNESTSDLLNPPLIDDVTYNEVVKSIIDNNCISCHAATPVNNAPMSLTTYENVKDAVLTRDLLDRISLAQGAPGMMPNGGTRLPQAKIDQITTWASQGFQQ